MQREMTQSNPDSLKSEENRREDKEPWSKLSQLSKIFWFGIKARLKREILILKKLQRIWHRSQLIRVTTKITLYKRLVI